MTKAREEWESESGSRGTQAQTSSPADTHLLVAAVGMGKGLKVCLHSTCFVTLKFLTIDDLISFF